MPPTLSPPISTIEYWCVRKTHDTLKRMADDRRFSQSGSDRIQTLNSKAIIVRFNRRPRHDQKTTESPESTIDNPGIIITYLGHNRPVTAGENNADDGVIRILIQIVDAGDDGDFTNGESYLLWMSEIRKALQGDHSRPSPLEQCPLRLGQVYLVHVSESDSADETDWAFSEHMRMALNVQCFTRTPRITKQGG